MDSTSDDEQARNQARDAFLTDLKAKIAQAQAEGQSPEQIRALASRHAREMGRQQLPQLAAQARSWWYGFRNFLMVGGLALGLSIALGLFVEYRYAAPLCRQYGAQHGLTYQGIRYPVIGKSSSTTSSSGSCRFVDATGREDHVSLTRLEPNWAIEFAVSWALQLELTTAFLFVLIALLAVGIGRLRK